MIPSASGRTWDLRSAYKQLAVKSDHKRFAWIAVMDPASSSVKLAQWHSMPFGAVAAVHAFLRCSEALKCVARGKFALAMTSFFDEFTVISTKASAAHVVSVVQGMFRRLGWQVATEEKKNHPFSEIFDVLSVRVDLSKQTEGLVFVGNTPSRRDELKASVNEILKAGHITFEEFQRLRGRLVFAEQSVWGRNARQAVICVGDVAPDTAVPFALTETQSAALAFLLRSIVGAPPKCISCAARKRFFCAWMAHANGSLRVRHPCVPLEQSSCPLPDTSRGGMNYPSPPPPRGRSAGKRQLVFECELLPYLLSLRLWHSYVKDCDLLVFIDNDAARSSLEKAFTRVAGGARVVHEAVATKESLALRAAFFRVPTASNIADGPSRMDFSLIQKLGGTRVFLHPKSAEVALGLY